MNYFFKVHNHSSTLTNSLLGYLPVFFQASYRINILIDTTYYKNYYERKTNTKGGGARHNGFTHCVPCQQPPISNERPLAPNPPCEQMLAAAGVGCWALVPPISSLAPSRTCRPSSPSILALFLLPAVVLFPPWHLPSPLAHTCHGFSWFSGCCVIQLPVLH